MRCRLHIATQWHWLTLTSCVAFWRLAVPRKEISKVSLPHATRHLVLVAGSRSMCSFSKLYSCIAVVSDSFCSVRPCPKARSAMTKVTKESMYKLSVTQSLTGLCAARHQGGGDMCLETRHVDFTRQMLMSIKEGATRSYEQAVQLRRHSTAQHSTAQHSTAQHSTAQHSRTEHTTVQDRTAQHGKQTCMQYQPRHTHKQSHTSTAA